MGRKQTQLTPNKIGEIRARVTNGESKTSIARDFGISRKYVYDLMKDERFDSVEVVVGKVIAEKTEKQLAETIEPMLNKVLAKIDAGIDNEVDLRKLNDLAKTLFNIVQIAKNKPTSINESRKLTVELKDVMALSPEKRAEYLMGKLPEGELCPD